MGAVGKDPCTCPGIGIFLLGPLLPGAGVVGERPLAYVAVSSSFSSYSLASPMWVVALFSSYATEGSEPDGSAYGGVAAGLALGAVCDHRGSGWVGSIGWEGVMVRSLMPALGVQVDVVGSGCACAVGGRGRLNFYAGC